MASLTRTASSLRFFVRVVGSTLRQRPISLSHIGDGPPAFITPQGQFMPGIAGGAPEEGEETPEKGKAEPEKGEAEKGKGEGGGEEAEETVTPEDDWKAKSRKNETRAKKAEREAKEAKEALAKREEADQSESEKAVAKAKKEGRDEALSESEKERRSDRLEVAVTRIAATGIKKGEGDEAKTVKFADPDDALVNIERAISRGEVDAEDIFDNENKVKTDALKSELEQLLERKPHLAAGETERSAGDGDLRKGETAKSDLEAMSPEDHAKRKYPAPGK